MRVQRDFQQAEVVRRLETIDEGVLALVLEDAPDRPQELTDWQREGVLEAMHSLETGQGVDHERVEEWVSSWTDADPLPMPR
ncbi:MAG: hypothetical protein HQL82_10625 [Magnetococcales bacterium]|nr:hypothetical protein [Magnetococcales bacterium]